WLLLATGIPTPPDAGALAALVAPGVQLWGAPPARALPARGARPVSLNGRQAGVLTDTAHGNARMRSIDPARIVAALEQGLIVLVTGYQGVTDDGDVTTLGRGGSDASAIAVAAALGLPACDIWTDVPGVFTADPRVVPDARRLDRLSHEAMLQLAEAGAQVMQPRAVELAAAHGVAIHVRSSFTGEPGTWITEVREEHDMFETARITGVAHRRHDPLYQVDGLTPAQVSAALAGHGLPVGSIIGSPGELRFTSPGAEPQSVIAALGDIGAAVAVHDEELGSVSVAGDACGNRSEVTLRILESLESTGIRPVLVTSTPSRVSCHVASGAVDEAARVLHSAFGLHTDAAAPQPVGAGRAN
ncbi:aspartate kinase, partial [Streptomyces sp. NPDC054987]